ncbi:DNRLRE domain-containing protein [Kitasatospora sp. NBC_00240]|uniref:DNRLRE domain-containing protein n=1 Tax=Kitasatospora sp. NBC_00240 TaxID=2903567 RepID=UPI00224D6D22|nr:DNRLRE domain-containing protein [Kitasatospora sp. NBC_00240]MCX5214373.1 DNRLRE domain-containing protein [Kitasatospora sp. NBC_00240]
MRRISSLAALVLLVQTGVVVDALTAPTATAAPAPQVTAASTEAPDEASALLSARLQGHRVEVTGARTPTVTLWANPDGTLTQIQATGPVRMKVGEAWVPVDTTLVQTPDGKVAPKAHPEGLVFGGGDAGVTVGDKLPGTATAPATPSPSPSPVSPVPTASAGTSTTGPGTTPSGVPATAPASKTPTSTAPASTAPTAATSPAAAPTATGSAPAEAARASRGAARAAAPAAESTALVPAERELVKVGSGGQEVKFGWLGKLPQPRLEGSRATYVDARPGVDLVLQATRTGFEQFLVVRDRSAVSQAGTLTLPLDTTGLSVAAQADGSIQLLDSAGKPAVKIPAPVMWDARLDEGSGEYLHRAPVAMELRGQGTDTELVFTPDAAFLADAATQFPVTVDPSVDLGVAFDTFVQKGVTSDQSSSPDLKLGTYDGGATTARSFLHFPSGPYAGKQILGASLNLYNFHSYSCTAAEWEVWDTDYAQTITRWDSQPYWGRERAWSTQTRDVDSGDPQQCTNGDGSGWVSADITGLVAEWAASGKDVNALGLKADNETSNNGWKRFFSSEGDAPPYLSVTYNTPPAAPQTAMTPSVPGGVQWSSAANPTFTSYAYDADPGGQVWVDFELWTAEGRVGAFNRQVPNGTVVAVTPTDFGVPRLDEERQYAFRSRIYDNYLHSAWSPDLTVRVDTVKPGAPFVTSGDYPSDTAWHGAAGQAGTFTFTTPQNSPDVVGYVYSVDGGSQAEAAGTGAATVSWTPPTDGHRVLKVQTKDRAGNLSDPTTYAFQVGRGGISSPVDGSQVAKRVKLSVDAQSDFKRIKYQYRRGPGATEYDVPVANLTKADNTPVTDAKPRLADLGGWANWTVVDTLGTVGGIVQVRALLFPEDGSGTGYATGWNTMTVDRNADGAAGTTVGPGSVNLLTGDYSTDVTDADEFGMSVARTSSSRGTGRGWQPQAERLTANQHQITTDLTGIAAGQATLARSTARGHDTSTDSLLVVPTGNDSYAALGPEYTLGQNMKPGRTYRLTGWIYVPGATGLNPTDAGRGLRLLGFQRTPAAGYTFVSSAKAGFTDGWQQLSVDMAVPADATEAWFRLYNGFAGGSGKEVYFDDLSVKEIVAPFGPQWAGGPDAGTGSDYRSLSFPQSDLAEIKGNDDSVLTFAKALDGTLWPEPGAESLSLKATGAGTYTLTDLDGSSTVFTAPSGSDIYQVTTETGPEAASQTRYVYDTTDGRALPKRVIAPVEPGVDDTNHCTLDPLPRGCEVMDYDYATATTATASVPGDFTDRIRSVKVWSWNPDTSQQSAVEVTHYTYDSTGRLAQVWDPRLATPLKTSYTYDSAGRVTRITAAGELPWDFDFGPAGSDLDPGRLLKVRRATLTPGSKNQVNGEIGTKVVYDVPLTTGAGGPYAMSGADTRTWAQTDSPTDATAVFGPEDEPGTNTAGATTPGKDGYKSATVHYLNASGNEVNTATPSVTAGGDIDTTEYDRYGHAVRTLQATNRTIALGTHPDAARFAAELNLPADSASRAQLLDSRTTYTPDGLDVVETLGPRYSALLTENIAGQSTPASQLYEAENLVQLGTTATVRTDTNGCCSVTWSGAGQLGIRGTKVGDSDTVRISVPEEGTYQLGGLLTKASDHGIFQWTIDSDPTPVGGPIDGYGTGVSVQPYTAGTTKYLTRGDHQLTLTFTGTNPASTGERYHAGIDTVTLTKSTLNAPIAAGTKVTVRDHNTNTYDQNKPDGQAYHLVTTATDGARIDGYAADVEQRVTKNGYGAPIGGTPGWTLKKATSVTTDAAGANLTTSTRYDASGRTEETRVPGSAAADASTVTTAYYTAGSNPAAACADRPEWAGQPCTTGPGAAVTGADSTRMPTTLPVKQVTRYSRTGKAEEVTETNAGKSRTTVTTYDAIGRTTSTATTGTEGQAVPKADTEYDPATGAAVKTTAAGRSVTTVKDILGRVISYTDADGATTSTEYDRYGKPTKVTDPTGNTVYTYDRAQEPRGMVTSVKDSTTGEFTARYSPDGQLTEQTYPGGIVRKDTLNASGKPVARSYTRTSDNAVLWSQSNDLSTQGQLVKDSTTNGTKAYGYDRLGRLVKAEQTSVTGGCTTRTYTYDTHYNRTARAQSPAAADGACSTAGATTETHTYDSADRITDPGYTYDAFGRTLTTATAATVTYRVNDLVASQETATTRRTWTLDPAGRLAACTTATRRPDNSWAPATAKLNHYGDTGDNPRWTVEDTTTGTWTRNTSGPDGNLTATSTNTGGITLQLTNLFGSVVLTTDTALTTPVLADYDEFGNPAQGRTTSRYGWLGAQQRSAEAQDGIVLMGVRLYSTSTGRFLSVDPVTGGSANAYEYNYADPINRYDLDGRSSWLGRLIRPTPTISWTAVAKLAGRKTLSTGKQAYQFTRLVTNRLTVLGVNYATRTAAPFLGYSCSSAPSIMVCKGGWGLHSRGGTTLGSTYFTDNNPRHVEPDRLEHEHIHTLQWLRYGPLFPFRYFSAGVNPCTNRYEQQAGWQKGGYTQCG